MCYVVVFFNLIFDVFRRDSDIWDPYDTAVGILKHVKRKQYGRRADDAIDDVIKRKRHLATWVVSNCDFTKGSETRRKFSDDLIKAGLDLHRRFESSLSYVF